MQQSHGTGFPFIGVVVVLGRREAVAGVLCNTSALDFSFFVSGSFDIAFLGWLVGDWFICGSLVKS